MDTLVELQTFSLASLAVRVSKLSVGSGLSNTPRNGTHETNGDHVMEKPAVTLGMCMRNSEKQIGDAIRSITEQDFPHDLMEIIVVDDGSEDRSLSIVKSWISKTDIKMKVFSYCWRGIAKSRNTILNEAEGEFIIWIDSDEIFPKSYVQDQVEFMKKNPQVGIASGIHGAPPKSSLILYLELLTSNAEYLEGLRLWNAGVRSTNLLAGTGASIFRVDALKQVNGFNDRLRGVGEDVDVALRIVEVGWQMGWHSSVFYETHGGLDTPKQLWNKYFWRGYHCWVLYTINKNYYFSLARISPLGSIVAGILRAIKAYKLTYMKRSFLIPVHFTFKMLAWCTGFIKAQTNRHTKE